MRVPLKLPESKADVKERKHLQASFDGLKMFFPLDIYPENIASLKGLLSCLRRVQLLDGFGLEEHDRRGMYFFLHADVNIYWRLIRILYSYSGMARVRNDLFICFGFWHLYHYGYIAVWHEFRATFLAPAFFALFSLVANSCADPNWLRVLLYSPGSALLILTSVMIWL